MRHLVLLAGLVLILVPANAHAGNFDVLTCSDSATNANHSWTASNDDPAVYEIGGSCAGGGAFGGLWVRDNLAATRNAVRHTGATWRFEAPAGTLITRFSYARYIYGLDEEDFRRALHTNDGAALESCEIPPAPYYQCTVGSTSGFDRASFNGISVSGLSFGVRCETQPNTGCVGGATIHSVIATLYGATVTLSDPTPPSLPLPTGDLWSAGAHGGFHKGTASVTGAPSDGQSGIKTLELVVDGVVVASCQTTGSVGCASTVSCDFTYAKPCSNPSAQTLGFDTSSVADGQHAVTLRAADAGGELATRTTSIVVDNGAPQAPSVSVPGQARTTDEVVATVSPVGTQVSPVQSVVYEACGAGGCATTTAPAAAGGATTVTLGKLPAGRTTLRTWLVDAAGNSDPGTATVSTVDVGTPVLEGEQGGSDSGTGSGGSNDGGTPAALVAPVVVAPMPPTPSPTAPGKPAPLALTRSVQGRTLAVRVRLRGADGRRVRVTYTVRDARKRRLANGNRLVRLKDGAASVRVTLPRSVRRRAREVVVTAQVVGAGGQRATSRLRLSR
ncbi:hypothetical protein [Conexibacter sp. SYSU D00693]|uniref:hypothetical protein n=1 Tax=Conexibacter sp. SYSU D00693 TaxID=2812560 RepID=UPI00196AC96E|nr:hypothetical protein [Conexibacter sp. SYSU D00693]